MKFEHTQVMNFEGALRGMRNPLNSWHKSDSIFGICNVIEPSQFEQDTESRNTGYLTQYSGKPAYITYLSYPYAEYVSIGDEDMKLAQKLIRAGSEHRKFMRQIFVCVDITAPLYWWKEFDTYKIGTVANSTSTMHKLATTPITIDCFDIDDYDDYQFNDDLLFICNNYQNNQNIKIQLDHKRFKDNLLYHLEALRLTYLRTKDKRYWKELIRWLPESWLQTRTVTLNYENLLAMCSKGQRRFHKLNEWSGQDNPALPNFISWARTLPYAQELIFIDEIDKPKKES